MSDPLARMANGSWVRSRLDVDSIVVEIQEQWKREGGWMICRGPNGEELWRRSLGDVQGGPAWLVVGQIDLAHGWDAFMRPALTWQDLVHAMQRHVVALIAAGWGESDQDVLATFADPLEMRCFPIGQVYKIIGSQDPLVGLEQRYLEMQEDAEGKLFLRFLGTEMPVIYLEVEAVNNETEEQAAQRLDRIQIWVRALFLATHPLVSCR